MFLFHVFSSTAKAPILKTCYFALSLAINAMIAVNNDGWYDINTQEWSKISLNPCYAHENITDMVKGKFAALLGSGHYLLNFPLHM